MNEREELIKNIHKSIKAKGKTELLRYLEKGTRLTQRQAILANCYICMGYYSDGKQDCLYTNCPLYEYMPYRGIDNKKTQETKIKIIRRKMRK